MSKQGFVLVDGLLALLILSVLAGLTVACFNVAAGYERGFEKYRIESEDYYRDVFCGIGACVCHQEDL